MPPGRSSTRRPGAIPIASRLPLVVTLLDLAPWELPGVYQRSPAAAFGQRLRGQILRDAAGGDRRYRGDRPGRPERSSRSRPERIVVIPLAARAAFQPAPPSVPSAGARNRPSGAGSAPTARVTVAPDRERLGLPERYLVYSGRYDARQDLGSLLGPLRPARRRGSAGRARSGRRLAAPSPADGRLAGRPGRARPGLGPAGRRGAPGLRTGLSIERFAALVAGARAAILPSISESAGLSAIEAMAAGTPVIASAVGALPEIVGRRRDPGRAARADRLAAAIAAAWTDDDLWPRLRAEALARGGPGRRTWADVARATRVAYTDVGARRGPEDEATGIGRSSRAARREAAGRAVMDRDRRAPGQDVHERLADRQVDLVALAVVEQGRAAQRSLLPGALDRVAVGRRPRPARCRRPSPRDGAYTPRRH